MMNWEPEINAGRQGDRWYMKWSSLPNQLIITPTTQPTFSVHESMNESCVWVSNALVLCRHDDERLTHPECPRQPRWINETIFCSSINERARNWNGGGGSIFNLALMTKNILMSHSVRDQASLHVYKINNNMITILWLSHGVVGSEPWCKEGWCTSLTPLFSPSLWVNQSTSSRLLSQEFWHWFHSQDMMLLWRKWHCLAMGGGDKLGSLRVRERVTGYLTYYYCLLLSLARVYESETPAATVCVH